MRITDIRVRQVYATGKMKAKVSITFDDEFVVHEIKVIESEEGVFIAMPNKRLSGGEYKDIAHPINRETRLRLQEAILDAYEKQVASSRRPQTE
jgi:stage V sporulation protein G